MKCKILNRWSKKMGTHANPGLFCGSVVDRRHFDTIWIQLSIGNDAEPNPDPI